MRIDEAQPHAFLRRRQQTVFHLRAQDGEVDAALEVQPQARLLLERAARGDDQGGQDEQSEEETGQKANYIFEPEPEDILGFLLPRYIEGAVLQGMLEAAASEHAARRRAMKAATDNADELIEGLTRVYNQARQAEITTEIMEVIGGAEALSAARGKD